MLQQLRKWMVIALVLGAVPALAQDPGDSSERIFFLQHHSFSRAEARLRVQQLLDYWKQRFGVTPTWHGDVAHVVGRVFGVEFDADVTVSDHEVKAQTSDPGSFFRGAAVDYVRRKLKKYLHPTYQEG